ncbi:hypothetical protein UFOVP79_28 [uncultured Caudovirales phage]|uniref:Uncharacterized protein n=1 Tax=uncultured Caudovirales phage TaxID=2100421 RepID=A0A6J5KWN1_9CAUD|nr:hypothetical protein UFOVP79_28 [uncultured Caudovirales phage]
MIKETNTEALLNYLVTQTQTGQKNWFGFQQQRVAGIDLAYRIAALHADKMTPDEVVNFVVELNNSIYNKMIKG